MHISLENPDYRFICRGVSPSGVLVNNLELRASFILAPNQLHENWALRDMSALEAEHWQPVIALQPGLFILGTGETQVFPEPKHLAFFLQQGIGFEVMNNAAAARTFNILANEGRNVVAGFVVA
ncbi:MAG: hypothetical protein KA218_01150 [Arenimonas sp.]|nr:hypothetical protein [Arenimonas sp.]